MKKAIMIAAALMMFAATAKAQVFILDDDEFAGNRQASDGSLVVDNPWQDGLGVDVYVPAGEGIERFTVFLVAKVHSFWGGLCFFMGMRFPPAGGNGGYSKRYHAAV